jgi:hypothetical protein
MHGRKALKKYELFSVERHRTSEPAMDDVSPVLAIPVLWGTVFRPLGVPAALKVSALICHNAFNGSIFYDRWASRHAGVSQ